MASRPWCETTTGGHGGGEAGLQRIEEGTAAATAIFGCTLDHGGTTDKVSESGSGGGGENFGGF